MGKLKGKGSKNSKRGRSKLESALTRYQVVSENKKHTDSRVHEQDILRSKRAGKQKGHKLISSDNFQKPFIPFKSHENVLLVGEGDFSFALSIINSNYVMPSHLWATSLDSEDEIISKYPHAVQTLQQLRGKGVKLVFEVDGTRLCESLKLSSNTKKYSRRNISILETDHIDLIMFNFPHTGKGIKDVERNIIVHQRLLEDFFKSCLSFFDLLECSRDAVKESSTVDAISGYKVTSFDLSESAKESTGKGRIALSLFEGEPYDSWIPRKIARKSINYKVERSGKFQWEAFEGYHHRRTNSMRDTTKIANSRDARLYVFESNKEQGADASNELNRE
ncbi:hypothetical protein OGAPHI_006420 [Ogataea philodendri]|uniref:25S rRNA (uridine-N(3))-methyltransferase BMT5-like domain-containing protein n=1 Tax=Ogataea philodendri TaxID=1378263 RepID=A0A9P8NYK0_9ASCO|nr:uncharacterized protein OGAPHI_006420 [Ogataea philodendri]KAH3661572.1 hypothetical protein OGAPHI_006420 [Ogataea philodendri]